MPPLALRFRAVPLPALLGSVALVCWIALPAAAYARPPQDAGGAKTIPLVDLPLPQLVRAVPELKKLRPASSQEPLIIELQKVGQNVAALFKSLPNVTCREKVVESQLGRDGFERARIIQEFNYLILGSGHNLEAGFDEYRTNSKGKQVTPTGLDAGFLVTQGFVSMPIYFHPQYQPDSRFRYLGQEALRKRQTEVIAFAQEPNSQLKEQFVLNGKAVPILMQGVAWIDNGQIVRLRTSLLAAHPEIGLDWQSTEIALAPVTFDVGALKLWLPRQVEVETKWKGFVFRNVHSYLHYEIFRVRAGEGSKPGP
ncbi:MAG TPA: hypothetical protein VI455_11870 [Terriglobia bacterium]